MLQQYSMCGSYVHPIWCSMSDSLGSSLRYPLSCCKHYANMVAHNDETLRQIQELSEEYDIRRKETLDTFAYWKIHQRTTGSAEYLRQLMIITEETREQLEILVGHPIPLGMGRRVQSLLRAFAEALGGYRAPSRSRSRSGSRWQHPVEHSYELEPP